MRKTILILLAYTLCMASTFANITLPKIFGDNMVLQRNKPINIWGLATPNEKITVAFNKQTKTIKADKTGKWLVQLAAESAGGPFQLTVSGKTQVAIQNILVGEIWICSGQSNMEMPIAGWGKINNYQQEINEADYPEIRHFKVPNTVSATLKDDLTGGDWKICSPTTSGDFSATAYFFARELYKQLKVPIGLINTSWGGTNSETWTSKHALEESPALKYIEDSMKIYNPPTSSANVGPNDYPSLLFNGMINPLVNYTIAGAIWYQGESNGGRAYQYRTAFPLMINDWRENFKQGDFPFLFVQLSTFGSAKANSATGSNWAELREAQSMTLSLPHTGMAVTTDIGNPADIHPKNKQDVGKRLANIALHDVYHKTGEYTGPVYQSMKVDNDKITLLFAHTGSGLLVKDKYGYLKGFEVAGADKQFHYAKAWVEGDKIMVSCIEVSQPVAVRYNWADDASEGNLFNKELFPAAPFRTDDWQSATIKNKYMFKK